MFLLLPILLAATPSTEICDGIDNDLDGVIDNGLTTCDSCAVERRNDSAYLICTDRTDQPAAKTLCAALGYHLVDVGSGGEDTFLRTHLDPTERYWLSGEDSVTDGVWIDSTGNVQTYFGWDAGEPNGMLTEQCLSMWNTTDNPHGWHDIPCDWENRRICEVECTPVTWYHDDDDDGFGTGPAQVGCHVPELASEQDGDCDDTHDGRHPGAPEICDGLDNDCDGEAEDTAQWYLDLDGDGFGTGFPIEGCDQPDDSASLPGDCNDQDARLHPGAVEWCDGLDNDCNGSVDDACRDDEALRPLAVSCASLGLPSWVGRLDWVSRRRAHRP